MVLKMHLRKAPQALPAASARASTLTVDISQRAWGSDFCSTQDGTVDARAHLPFFDPKKWLFIFDIYWQKYALITRRERSMSHRYLPALHYRYLVSSHLAFRRFQPPAPPPWLGSAFWLQPCPP